MAWDSTSEAPPRHWAWSESKAMSPTPHDEVASVKAILQVIGDIKDKIILDLGVGRGACLKMVSDAMVRMGVDSSEGALRAAQIAVPDMLPVLADARRTGLPGGTAHVVWSHGVVEHFTPEELEDYVKEAVRLSCEYVAFSAPNPRNPAYAAFKKLKLENETWEWGYEEPLNSYADILSRHGCEIVLSTTSGRTWKEVSIYGRHSDKWRQWKLECDAGVMPGISTVVVAKVGGGNDV